MSCIIFSEENRSLKTSNRNLKLQLNELENKFNIAGDKGDRNSYLYADVVQYCNSLERYIELYNKTRTYPEQTEFHGITIRSSRGYTDFNNKLSMLINSGEYKAELVDLRRRLKKLTLTTPQIQTLAKKSVPYILNSVITQLNEVKNV